MCEEFPRNEFIKVAREKGHSTEYIEEVLTYIDTLESQKLPVIFSTKHLSEIVNIPYSKLKHLIKFRERYYGTFKLSKKRGGYREISCPNNIIKSIQRWINTSILKVIRPDNSCKSYMPGSSILNNAEMHKDQEAILKMDFYRFFDTITEKKVYLFFKSLGYLNNVAFDLARLTTITPRDNYRLEVEKDKFTPKNFRVTDEGFLPQGAPTSPLLSNLIARRLDVRLRKLAQSLNVTYSRYADDITFSGEIINLPRVGLVNKIVEEEGFFLNKGKTSIRKQGQKQIVTGLTVSNGVHVPKRYKKEIWKHLYYCKKFGPNEHLDHIGMSKSSYRDWLFGRISYVYCIEPHTGIKMMEKFNEIPWPFFVGKQL
ncbi:reverse transcriptase family protein [Priestia megaterium]